MVGWSASVHSPSIDETGHLPAGLSHWRLGRFDLYAVNPPLVRTAATDAILCRDLQIDWSAYSSSVNHRSEFAIGQRFFQLNGLAGIEALTIARISLISIGAVMIVICWKIAATLKISQTISIPTAVLACFSPSLLGNGSMITPDFASVVAGFLAWCFIVRWSENNNLKNANLAGVVIGCAILTKLTCLVFAILLPITAIISVPAGSHRKHSGWLTLVLHCLMAFSIAVYMVNLGYLFEETCSQLGELPFVSRNFMSTAALAGENRFSGSWVGDLRIPLPRNFMLGIDAQAEDFETGFRSYLTGEWKHGGWWYYYLIGFLVKEPIGFQLMLYLSILHGLCNWKHWTRESFREWSKIVLPPVLIFGLVSSQTGFNHHMRYVLPAYPFLFIIAARTATLGKFWKWFSYACLTWQAAAVLWFAPHWMSYFNEFAGGPKNGHKWLVDSNIDWGQDILMLKWWQDKHPEAAPLNAAMYTMFDPKDIGLKFRLPPPFVKGQPEVVNQDGLRGPQSGWYAVSVCMLKGQHASVPEGDGKWSSSTENFTYFLDNFEPVDMIGYSIYIYHITAADAARMRAKLLAEEAEFLKAEKTI